MLSPLAKKNSVPAHETIDWGDKYFYFHYHYAIKSKALKEVLVLLGNGDCRPPRGTHLFEVGCIVGVLDGGPPGHPRVPDVGPVKLLEPLVLLDIVAVVAGAEPTLGVGVEEAEDEVLRTEREEVGELDYPL